MTQQEEARIRELVIAIVREIGRVNGTAQVPQIDVLPDSEEQRLYSLPAVVMNQTGDGFESYVAIKLNLLWDETKTVTDEAKSARDAANTAANRVDTAIGDAEQATSAANSAATNANTSRQQIESNESTRQRNETGRVTAETGRVTAENGRVTAETGRTTAENGRVNAESGRVNAETSRVEAETARETQASNDHTRAENDHAAIELSLTAAGNVDADMDGMTVIITNRNGVTKRVSMAFDIYDSYPSVASMLADVSHIPNGGLASIATDDPTDADNAKLYQKRSDGTMVYVGDLDQASAHAWLDWLNNKKPLIESATSAANTAATNANDKASLAGTIYNTVRAWYNGTDNNGFKATVETWISNTQTAWNDWFSDSLATGVRKLWNDFWTNINSRWENFFGEETGTVTKGVQKIWADWFAGRATDWNNYKDAKDTDWSSYKSGKDTDWNSYKDGKDSNWNTYKSGKDSIWDNWFGADDNSGVRKQWKDTKADAVTATNNANDKADYAENVASHPSYIADGTQAKPGDIGYVYQWDYANQIYVRGIRVSLDWNSMSQETKDAIAAEMLANIAFDERPTEDSNKAVRSSGLYLALAGKQDKLDFATDEDAAAIWENYQFATTD